MPEKGAPTVLRITRWTPGELAIANVQIGEGSLARPLVAIEAIEKVASILAGTSEPQASVANRMAPDAPSPPVGLLAAIRSGRVYLALEQNAMVEVECQIQRDPGELAIVRGELRTTGGGRAAKAELKYLIVPGAGEHLRDAQARDAARGKLLEGW